MVQARQSAHKNRLVTEMGPALAWHLPQAALKTLRPALLAAVTSLPEAHQTRLEVQPALAEAVRLPQVVLGLAVVMKMETVMEMETVVATVATMASTLAATLAAMALLPAPETGPPQ